MNAFAKLESLLKPNPFDALAALIRSDASVSTAQHNAMEAAAHGHSTLGIPEDVGAEFVAQDMRNDADRWITVHGNGGSSPALIGEDGTVKGGMGGKFNGKNIKDAHGTKEFTSGETNAETAARNNTVAHRANELSKSAVTKKDHANAAQAHFEASIDKDTPQPDSRVHVLKAQEHMGKKGNVPLPDKSSLNEPNPESPTDEERKSLPFGMTKKEWRESEAQKERDAQEAYSKSPEGIAEQHKKDEELARNIKREELTQQIEKLWEGFSETLSNRHKADLPSEETSAPNSVKQTESTQKITIQKLHTDIRGAIGEPSSKYSPSQQIDRTTYDLKDYGGFYGIMSSKRAKEIADHLKSEGYKVDETAIDRGIVKVAKAKPKTETAAGHDGENLAQAPKASAQPHGAGDPDAHLWNEEIAKARDAKTGGDATVSKAAAYHMLTNEKGLSHEDAQKALSAAKVEPKFLGGSESGGAHKVDRYNLRELDAKPQGANEEPQAQTESSAQKNKRLEILENSLKNKEQKFSDKLNAHWEDVKSANGQPLNDKRNGHVTLNRWENQNNSLRNHNEEIEKTKQAIEREKQKIANVEGFDKPKHIDDAVNSGELAQWRKHPNHFFVNGVDKARISIDPETGVIGHKYLREITDKEQYAKFRDTFNRLRNDPEQQKFETASKERTLAEKARKKEERAAIKKQHSNEEASKPEPHLFSKPTDAE